MLVSNLNASEAIQFIQGTGDAVSRDERLNHVMRLVRQGVDTFTFYTNGALVLPEQKASQRDLLLSSVTNSMGASLESKAKRSKKRGVWVKRKKQAFEMRHADDTYGRKMHRVKAWRGGRAKGRYGVQTKLLNKNFALQDKALDEAFKAIDKQFN